MQTFITKTFWVLMLSLGVFCLGGSPAFAKEATYKIGIGDVLDVKVFGEAEFSGVFRVGSDGTIDFPFLRKIKADGRTTEELGQDLTKLLKDGYLAEPQVNIEMKDYKSQSVLVLGAVPKPGTYVLQEETRILDMISKAGGIGQAGAKKILLIRGKAAALLSAKEVLPTTEKETTKPIEKEIPKEKEAKDLADGKPIVIDYYRLVHEGDFTQNLLLQDGDVINIPKANEIFVLGNVARPGPIPFEENMFILQAITLAGGPTPIASTKSTYILRQGTGGEEKIPVRLDKIMDNKSKNVILKADDVIVVPESFF